MEDNKDKGLQQLVDQHVKVPSNKVLVKIRRVPKPTIITVDTKDLKYERFHPVFGIGEGVRNFNVGEYVSLKPEVKFEIIELFGEEFVFADNYTIEYGVTAEYALFLADLYKKDKKSIIELEADATKEARSDLFTGDSPELKPAIMGSWKNKSKPN